MTENTPAPAVEIDGHGVTINLSPETEAQAYRRGPAETEAHALRHKGPAETEAHGFSTNPADPALDAHAHIRLTFPAGAPEQTLELRYRPSATPGEPPEVELHRRHFGR